MKIKFLDMCKRQSNIDTDPSVIGHPTPPPLWTTPKVKAVIITVRKMTLCMFVLGLTRDVITQDNTIRITVVCLLAHAWQLLHILIPPFLH